MERPLVQIVAHGPTSATTRLWRYCGGPLRVTVIAKATFSLVHQAIMKLAPPEPIVLADVHHGNNPVRSVRQTSDLAPYLPGTDVTLSGHAHAPPGTRAPWVTAGVALYDGYDCIFEKYLDVRGDLGPDGILPFDKMPLLYERAFGGPGWEDNPFGVGAGGARGDPNIFYIGDRVRSAGFGPLSPHWPARKKLVSDDTRKALALPVAEIPEGFDWTYYHATPRDQRCAFLGGSEWLVLQGLRPDERRVRSRLPAAKGRALVFWASESPGEGETLELIADTVRVDADRGTCSITWRKSFAVEDDTQLEDLRIMAAVELGGQPVQWPASFPTLPTTPAPAPARRPATAPLAKVTTTPVRRPATAPLARPATAPLPRPATAPFQQPATAPLPTRVPAPARPTTRPTTEFIDLPSASFGANLDEEEMETVRIRRRHVGRDSLPAGESPAADQIRALAAVTTTIVDEPPPPLSDPLILAAAAAAATTIMDEPPAPPPQPMILGAFRLAVFSPDYEADPDDPLLSTLVIRDKG